MAGSKLVKVISHEAQVLQRLDARVKRAGAKIGALIQGQARLLVSGEMLAVATGEGRKSIGWTYAEGLKATLIGVGMWYMKAYETGNWKRYSAGVMRSSFYSKQYRKIRKARMKEASPRWYKKSKRPFLYEAIRRNGAKIKGIVKKELSRK